MSFVSCRAKNRFDKNNPPFRKVFTFCESPALFFVPISFLKRDSIFFYHTHFRRANTRRNVGGYSGKNPSCVNTMRKFLYSFSVIFFEKFFWIFLLYYFVWRCVLVRHISPFSIFHKTFELLPVTHAPKKSTGVRRVNYWWVSRFYFIFIFFSARSLSYFIEKSNSFCRKRQYKLYASFFSGKIREKKTASKVAIFPHLVMNLY